jgi:hypothetical protein
MNDEQFEREKNYQSAKYFLKQIFEKQIINEKEFLKNRHKIN